ncbi:DUF4373 domain-containing protein [Parapedobacter indicus]|uniref:Lin1244/Lin1753-like N-terminal domain-containing protein n=1 Tax=Parapedobacter indicus TaxID=1477437 RepID=A0A1I3V3B5_9SPHI|nr:DUF4373 domain-containing protein [Parapedobacter indicus]PPK99013.1 uncharacterized protein DUF4373 [Parapedobacter indicus]SFJ88631.1 protein of unknown function [Parapedobacter indicus]
MAGRPKKNTVDYFPHYIGDGKKIQFIEAKYGNDGYATWYKILESLARTSDHYLNLNEEIDTMFLASKCRVDVDSLEAIITDLSKLGAINKTLWEHRIIWSEVFMESIKDAYRKRTSNSLTLSDICRHLYAENVISVDLNSISGAGNTRNIEREIEREIIEKEKGNLGADFDPPAPPKKSIEERKLSFKISVEKYIAEYDREMLNSFYRYWTEMNEGGRKMRFEMEKVFEVKKRLVTWEKNDLKFKSHQNGKSNQNNRARRHDPAPRSEGYGKL